MNKIIENIESIEIPIEKYPKNEEYKAGEVYYVIRNYNYRIRDTPLEEFKDNSPFRIYAENIAKENGLDRKKYTLLYHHVLEWYNKFIVSEIK